MRSPKLPKSVEVTVQAVVTGVFMIGWLLCWPFFSLYRRHHLGLSPRLETRSGHHAIHALDRFVDLRRTLESERHANPHNPGSWCASSPSRDPRRVVYRPSPTSFMLITPMPSP